MKKFLSALTLAIGISANCFAMPNDIEVEGVTYPEQGVSVNQARRIAVMDAYRYLAEQVDVLYVSADSTVKNMRDLDEKINTKVEAAIRGAKVVSITRAADGSFHAKVRLPVSGSANSIAAAVLPPSDSLVEFPKPRLTNIEIPAGYTGLVVDCKNLSLKEAITPAIKAADGREIYAYKNIGYSKTLEKGLVKYSKEADASRVGDKPLTVKAVSVSGGCDIIVSNEDADRILAANQKGNFLSSCAICLVR
ncbi:MAG: LPP20 family lipoprotein [Selenomonadaceae bacterium]|nr:LPP20 family lipoprotein [Selenomonadaceae bacterium]